MVYKKQTGNIVFRSYIRGLAEAFSVIRVPHWII